MKRTQQSMVAAAALCLSANALAAIDLDGNGTLFAGTGDGDTVFILHHFDVSSGEQRTYIRDLNYNVRNFVDDPANTVSEAFAATSTFNTFLGGVDTLVDEISWAVASLSNPNPTVDNWGFAVTGDGAPGALTAGLTAPGGQAFNTYNQWVGAANVALAGANDVVLGNVAAGDPAFFGNGLPGSAPGQDQVNSAFGFDVVGNGFGSILDFYYLGIDSSGGSVETQIAGEWSLDDTTGTLSFTSTTPPVTPVPIPAMAWLFGLLGASVIGTGRRRAA